MMSRWFSVAGALLLVLVLALVALLVLADSGKTPPEPEVAVATSRSDAIDDPRRLALPPPAGIEAPPASRAGPRTARMTPDDRRAMNVSVDDMLKVARADCLQPWVNDAGKPVELVFDVLLSDGRVSDIGMRPLGATVPEQVVSCVADKAWLADWPEWDLPGEIRLQRSINMRPN
jgi:hypothetical protein